jgi:benzoate membrane transport protein
MTSMSSIFNDRHWPSLLASTVASVVVGFASTILVIMQAADAVGASPAQKASWAAALCLGMAATTFILSWRFRMPIVTAWSTPGAVLIATSAAGISYPVALGAFVTAGVLMVITGLVRPLERAIEKMPAAIAAAMLAGVLLSYVLKVPLAALAAPWLVVPLVIAYFAMRMWRPIYAVPVVVVLGLALAFTSGKMAGACCSFGLTEPTFDMPQFGWSAMLGLGLPLYLVTMASQNLPGFAVMRACGYQPPVSACLVATGIGSIVVAPFGGHAINMAAITASMVAGPDSHPDPAQRWKVCIPYLFLYSLVGLCSAAFVGVLGALPRESIQAIAGLALFAPLMGGMSSMMKEPKDLEAALITFLVTASGFSLFTIGAAFWGLMAGVLLWGIKNLIEDKS